METPNNCVDILPWIQWDTFEAKKETLKSREIQLFTYPISESKSPLKTSMVEVNRLPDPQHMNITNLQIFWSPSNDPRDMEIFIDWARYEFWIGDRKVDYQPFIRFKYWNCTRDLNQILDKLKETNQLESRLLLNEIEYRIGDNPIGHHILQGQNFRVKVIFDDIDFCPKEDFKMVVILKGILSRSIDYGN